MTHDWGPPTCKHSYHTKRWFWVVLYFSCLCVRVSRMFAKRHLHIPPALNEMLAHAYTQTNSSKASSSSSVLTTQILGSYCATSSVSGSIGRPLPPRNVCICVCGGHFSSIFNPHLSGLYCIWSCGVAYPFHTASARAHIRTTCAFSPPCVFPRCRLPSIFVCVVAAVVLPAARTLVRVIPCALHRRLHACATSPSRALTYACAVAHAHTHTSKKQTHRTHTQCARCAKLM